jgi:PLD-like domain
VTDAIALSNNDVVLVAWRYAQAIEGCLGFEISRQENGADPDGNWVPLPAWVGFKGDKNPQWTQKTTTLWPIQKFEWKDLTATRRKSYGYRIVPMVGKPGSLKPQKRHALYTNTVSLTPQRGSFSAYFNRGILSTQFVEHQIKPGPSGAPNFRVLKDRIDQPGDPLRAALAGQIIEGVELLLGRAATKGGSCYAALYELDDPELVQRLSGMKEDELHLILSNTGADDATNAAARQTLHDSGVDITDRFLPSNHIGHNKFVAYVDEQRRPKAVLLGSTNWTDTGLCAQSNNALVVESPPLANAYVTYWKQLKTDEKQAPELRAFDAKPGVETKIDGADVTVCAEHAEAAGASAERTNQETGSYAARPNAGI